MHTIGITDCLLNALLVFDKMTPEVVEKIGDVLSHTTEYELALKEVEKTIDFIEPLLSYIQQIV